MLLTTVICIYFAYVLQILSKFTVRFLRLMFFKTWHLKCRPKLSNIARASSLLLKSRSISEHFTLQQDNAPAHRADETVEFLSRNTPDYIASLLWPPNITGLESGRLRSVGCAPRTRVPYPDSRPSKAAAYWRVESLRPKNHWPSSASVACSTAWVCSSKKRPLWAQTVTNIVLRDFSMLESWVFWCQYIICCISETKQWIKK